MQLEPDEVVISNTELVGPNHTINFPIDFESHFLGAKIYSSSTLSLIRTVVSPTEAVSNFSD